MPQTKASEQIARTVCAHYGYRYSTTSVVIDGSAVYAGSDYAGTIRDNGLRLDRAGFPVATFRSLDGLNPVVKVTALRAYPGWEVAEHYDGSFTVSNRNGLGWHACRSFADAVYFAKHGEPR